MLCQVSNLVLNVLAFNDLRLETRMDRDMKIYLVEYCKERKGNNTKSLGKVSSSKFVVQLCSLS